MPMMGMWVTSFLPVPCEEDSKTVVMLYRNDEKWCVQSSQWSKKEKASEDWQWCFMQFRHIFRSFGSRLTRGPTRRLNQAFGGETSGKTTLFESCGNVRPWLTMGCSSHVHDEMDGQYQPKPSTELKTKELCKYLIYFN